MSRLMVCIFRLQNINILAYYKMLINANKNANIKVAIYTFTKMK